MMSSSDTPELPAGLRVMVLEDEAVIAMLLGDMLEDLGCEVVGPAGNAQEALSLLAGEAAPDMALLDVQLSRGESSYGVAAALEKRRVPFVFVTGHGAAGLAPEYRDRPTLTKPFHRAALVDAVRRVSAQRKAGFAA